jgi:tetratricopeptide (TPR) repeat protein
MIPGITVRKGVVMRVWPAAVCVCVLAALVVPVPARSQVSAQASVGVDPVLQDFATRFAKNVNAGDVAAIRQGLDLEALINTAVKGLESSAEVEKGFKDGVRGPIDVSLQLAEATKSGGQYQLLRIRTSAFGRPQALFRLITKDGAVNYHEFALKKQPSGAVKAIDFYVFTNGEWATETIHRGWLLAAGESSVTSQVKRLAGVESDFIKSLPLIQEVNRYQTAQQYAKALESWRKLPPSLQTQKNLLLQRVNLARLAGEAEYNAAVGAFSRSFPSDPALDLIQVDVFLSRKQYAEGIAAMERIKRTIGGDPYLDFLQGNVYYEMKDFPKSRAALAAATTAEPTLVGPWWSLTTLAVEEKNHEETARLLTVLEKERGVQMGDLLGVDVYAEFVKSDAYKKWMRARTAR